MKCLVCSIEFDAAKPLDVEQFTSMGISQVEAEVLARRRRAAEQNAWQFVQVTLSGESVLEGHVCPSHANTESLSLSKGNVK
jgi:hypothetical protein